METPCPPWRISCLVPSWRKRCKSSKSNTANFHILLAICRHWSTRERVHNGPEAEGDTWIRKSNVLKCVSVVGRCNCWLYETGIFTDITPFYEVTKCRRQCTISEHISLCCRCGNDKFLKSNIGTLKSWLKKLRKLSPIFLAFPTEFWPTQCWRPERVRPDPQ